MRMLIAIPALDRDAIYFSRFYLRLKACLDNSSDEIDLMILTREQDKEIQHCWQEIPRAHIVTFENYEIEKRHNLEALVMKRNAAIKYAEENGYDLLWFLDSDIGVHPDTLKRLRQSIEHGADITVAPYMNREFNRTLVGIVKEKEDRAVAEGILDPHLIETTEIHFPIALSAFGCTLIDKRSLSLRCNIRMIGGSIAGQETGFTAEDIGYFLNAYHEGKKVYCLSNHLVDHFEDDLTM